MAKSSINLSLCLAGLIAVLSTETVEAGRSLGAKTPSNKKLYHERKGSQIEELFRKLPLVENEVEAVFDDASFLLSFGASPQADKTSNKDVEDLFRRILLSQEGGQEKVERRNLSFLGNKVNEAGVFGESGIGNRGSVRGSTSTDIESPADLLEDSEGAVVENYKSGKSMKNSKSGKKEHKEMKKHKRYKEEKGKLQHKLQKLTKSGKKEENFGYDPYDATDDLYAVADDFHFHTWEWEWDQEDSMEQAPVVETEDSFFSEMSGWQSGLVPADNAGDMMGRFDAVSEEGEYQFGNFLTNMDGPLSIETQKVGHYKFNFPTIQHTVFSGPVVLKAYSIMDLSSNDPEIFAVLQSILTPYLQQTMGSTLHAYNLEVDYSPANDKNVGENNVVTLMEVDCTFKVISDSIESFRRIDHTQASRWIHDFFSGPELYKLVEALKSNNIRVSDITFINQELQTSKTVSEANSQGTKNSPVFKKNTENSGGAAMVGVTLSVLIVGMLFFMHYTGRLPSKARIGEFSLNARDSIKQRVPSIKLGKKKGERNDDEIEGGGRRRTYSGTFRRFPVGGIRKAAIQKKPAKSEQYLGDSASDASSADNVLDQDTYSFSHYGGDYGPPTPSQQRSVPMTPVSRRTEDEFSMPSQYTDSAPEKRGETLLGKVGKTAAYLMNPGRKQQEPYATKSPIPSRAPRRVTASDIASPRDPDDVDSWSIDSYETGSPSPRMPSNQRGWSESGPEMRRPQVHGQDPPESRKAKLSMPFFS